MRIDRLDLRFEPRRWDFAEEQRAEIEAYFARLRADKPAIYNGRVLLMHRLHIADRVLRGAYLETDFASYITWRDQGWPGPLLWNCFAQGALRGSDGGYLLGVMGAHTVNAGKIYFPSGTPDPNDRVGDRVDLDASLAREVAEETGLMPSDYRLDDGWRALFSGQRLALIKIVQLDAPAAQARERIRAYLAREAEPELSDMAIVRGMADLSDRMPDFIRAYFADLWGL